MSFTNTFYRFYEKGRKCWKVFLCWFKHFKGLKAKWLFCLVVYLLKDRKLWEKKSEEMPNILLNKNNFFIRKKLKVDRNKIVQVNEAKGKVK